jgi:hypothetical protein
VAIAEQRAAVLRQHHAYVAGDSPFQSRLRLQQSLWRESHGLEPGVHNGAPLGSRLEAEAAAAGLNFVDPPAVHAAARDEDGLVERVRFEGNLLSSQPLAFNLFASLAQDLGLATSIFQHLLPGEVAQVLAIGFEHSPGRGDTAFLGNRSAFDVFIEYESPDGTPAFLGIEVKYHEDLSGPVPGESRPRYRQVAEASGAFRTLDGLWAPVLWQVWLDHLLALSYVQSSDRFDRGSFVLLAPAGNLPCRRAAADYRLRQVAPDDLVTWSLEDLLAVIMIYSDAPWLRRLWSRYGDQGRLLASGFPVIGGRG